MKFEILLISPQARGLKEGRTEVHRNIVLFCFVLIFCFCCNWLVLCRRYLYVTNTTWKNLTELKSQLQNHDEIEYTLLGRWKSRWKAWRMMQSGFGTGTSSSTGSFWCRKCIKTTWKERTGIYHRFLDRLASLSLFKHISDIVVVTKIFTFRQCFFFFEVRHLFFFAPGNYLYRKCWNKLPRAYPFFWLDNGQNPRNRTHSKNPQQRTCIFPPSYPKQILT